jgi:biotin transport system permease protein
MLTLTCERQTVAQDWPAGVKLAGLALWMIGLFLLPGLFPVLAALGLTGAAAFALGIGGEWLRLFRVLWPVALVLALWHLVTGTPMDGALAIARMGAAVGAANLVTMTTRLADMQAVVARAARPLAPILPPQALALAVALMIRFVPVMLQRWEALAMAYRARSDRRGNWRIAMPAVLAALDDAEHVADALRARGGAG